MIRIGTAGWVLPRASVAAFPEDGSHLARYARVMPCVEINSSFHRPHREATWRRWADSTPDDFRFAVKLPRTITHTAKLKRTHALLDTFMAEVAGLGTKLGILLVQLPPSLAYAAPTARAFFIALRARYHGVIACEPRNATWFTPAADRLLSTHRIARVAADPTSIPSAAVPGGWLGPDGDGRGATVYYRWHGAPRMYWSSYDDPWLAVRASALSRWPAACDCWCLFDNTASGAALGDALRLAAMVRSCGEP